MKNRKARPNGEQPSPANDLSRLIETEERLGQALAKAGEEAARLVVAAREAAAAAELDLERELARDRERVRTEVGREGADQAADLVAAARRAAALLDALPDTDVAELAELVLERLLTAAKDGGR